MSSCELCFKAEYFVTHEALKQTAELTEIPESVLFPVSLGLWVEYRVSTALRNQDSMNLEATEIVRATFFISSRSETGTSNVVE